jgi:hypothetical protein
LGTEKHLATTAPTTHSTLFDFIYFGKNDIEDEMPQSSSGRFLPASFESADDHLFHQNDFDKKIRKVWHKISPILDR